MSRAKKKPSGRPQAKVRRCHYCGWKTPMEPYDGTKNTPLARYSHSPVFLPDGYEPLCVLTRNTRAALHRVLRLEALCVTA